MDRKQFEAILLNLMKAIVDIYKVYDPDADYISMCYIKDDEGDYIHADNGNNAKKKVDLYFRDRGVKK